ncbi:hypothetical protein TNCV_1461641 [Trichonephila clavipes]|nr:hypothetical protein TNCV_1461641 [Trichonephila clavipes]
MTLKHHRTDVFEIPAIGMHARTTSMQRELAHMLENTRHFTDHSSNDGYSCHQVHFKIDGCVINRGSERSMFPKVLIHSSKCLMTRLPPRCKECFFSSDEAHFWLNGYVNKQNCRIWSEANPQVYVETPLHPEKLTVWCALGAGGILLQKR